MYGYLPFLQAHLPWNLFVGLHLFWWAQTSFTQYSNFENSEAIGAYTVQHMHQEPVPTLLFGVLIVFLVCIVFGSSCNRAVLEGLCSHFFERACVYLNSGCGMYTWDQRSWLSHRHKWPHTDSSKRSTSAAKFGKTFILQYHYQHKVWYRSLNLNKECHTS